MSPLKQSALSLKLCQQVCARSGSSTAPLLCLTLAALQMLGLEGLLQMNTVFESATASIEADISLVLSVVGCVKKFGLW